MTWVPSGRANSARELPGFVLQQRVIVDKAVEVPFAPRLLFGVDFDDLVLIAEAVPSVRLTERQDAAEIDPAAALADQLRHGAGAVEDQLLRQFDAVDSDQDEHLFRCICEHIFRKPQVESADVVPADAAVQQRMIREVLMQRPRFGDRVAVEEVPDMADPVRQFPISEDLLPAFARVVEFLDGPETLRIEQCIVFAAHLLRSDCWVSGYYKAAFAVLQSPAVSIFAQTGLA